MKTVSKIVVIDKEKCIGCALCTKVCPVTAISKAEGSARYYEVDEKICSGCGFCVAQCSQKAIRVMKREQSVKVGIMNVEVTEEIKEICRKAHMYPEQMVCFCHLVQAKEIAAAILQGARSPEDISRLTGARTGCGVLCISGIIRLLRAAGIELTKAPGNQWYGMDVSIWNIPESIREKYPEYFLEEDLRLIKEYFPEGGEK